MSNFASKLSDILHAFSSGEREPERFFNSSVIVAAGSGTRMCDELKKTKQLTEIDGIPAVIRAIQAFEACDFINEIIVVARADELSCYDNFIRDYGLKKLSAVVPGGETRQLSVLEGVKKVSDKADYIAIHDGARCLITPEMIRKVIKQAILYGAATAAERSKDTVKKSDKSGFIDETIDRAYLWHAQTPQIFKADMYRAAAFIGQKNGFEVTDDCMLAESIGFKIKLVDCGYENIKLTTPDDFAIASAILQNRIKREAGRSTEELK